MEQAAWQRKHRQTLTLCLLTDKPNVATDWLSVPLKDKTPNRHTWLMQVDEALSTGKTGKNRENRENRDSQL